MAENARGAKGITDFSAGKNNRCEITRKPEIQRCLNAFYIPIDPWTPSRTIKT